jgi:hypothetical protein
MRESELKEWKKKWKAAAEKWNVKRLMKEIKICMEVASHGVDSCDCSEEALVYLTELKKKMQAGYVYELPPMLKGIRIP